MTTDKTFVEAQAEKLAKRVLEGADTTLQWRDAGYRTKWEAAAALVGDGEDPDVRARAIEMVADRIA